MTRTAIGGERGDFGISAKQCPARLALSIADPRPGDVHVPARHPPAYRLPLVRGHRSDRPDRTVRGAVARSEFDPSHLRTGRPQRRLDCGLRPMLPWRYAADYLRPNPSALVARPLRAGLQESARARVDYDRALLGPDRDRVLKPANRLRGLGH